ncbi:kinetochore Sim4 complex subunit FTA2-domain-containing protein [Annulohypoxylon moriforme]|nr:kinetochore Sim4 complex subunit FTA2-domain-containing protein [Annulohypoxylon moriforme]
MYPDWPKSAADLVPLPRCDGPKLEPFDFRGSQKIEFLEYVGEGLHAHVFKVRIQEKIYALKLFRFVYDDDWRRPASDHDDVQIMTSFANYSEPFNCECRAYGRLRERGYEDLAIKSFGYILLDEDHERTMMNQFKDLDLCFNGNIEFCGYEPLRSRFPGKDGRDPPIRGIVKEFGQNDEKLTTRLAKSLLEDIVGLQQLGIFYVDVALRQVINGKLADFSTALTLPHYTTNPELNPNLDSYQKSNMAFETFQLCSSDYWSFDEMVHEWNRENKDKIRVYAFPGGLGCQTKYNTRSKSRREFYTHVDPRLPRKRVLKRRKVDRWNIRCSDRSAKSLRDTIYFRTANEWDFKDGYIFPKRRSWV